MWTLYHLWLDPHSRAVRVVLGEKKVDFHPRVEPVWERRAEFVALNPAAEVPVLAHSDGSVLSDSRAIAEYLDETTAEPPLLPGDAATRAEIRRLIAWFDGKFNVEVTQNLVTEKIMNRFLGAAAPNSRAIRAGKANIRSHLAYVDWLAERRRWLAGDQFSLADVVAAAHLSCVDYLGDVPWEEFPEAKSWYARIKSRPSFRPLLADLIPGVPPPKHYKNLDF